MSLLQTFTCLNTIWWLCWEDESPDFQLVPSLCTCPSVSSRSIIWDIQWYPITKLSFKELRFQGYGFSAAIAGTSPSPLEQLAWVSAVGREVVHRLQPPFSTTFLDNVLSMPLTWVGHVAPVSSIPSRPAWSPEARGGWRSLWVCQMLGLVRPKCTSWVATLDWVHRRPLWAAKLFTESIPKCFQCYAQPGGFWGLMSREAEHPWFLLTSRLKPHKSSVNVVLAPAPLISEQSHGNAASLLKAAYFSLMRVNPALFQLHIQRPPRMQARVPDLLPGGHKKRI